MSCHLSNKRPLSKVWNTSTCIFIRHCESNIICLLSFVPCYPAYHRWYHNLELSHWYLLSWNLTNSKASICQLCSLIDLALVEPSEFSWASWVHWGRLVATYGSDRGCKFVDKMADRFHNIYRKLNKFQSLEQMCTAIISSKHVAYDSR